MVQIYLQAEIFDDFPGKTAEEVEEYWKAQTGTIKNAPVVEDSDDFEPVDYLAEWRHIVHI